MSPIDPLLLAIPSDGINAEPSTEAGELGSLEQGQPLVDRTDLYGPAPAREEEQAAAELSTSSTVTSLSSRRAQVLPRLNLSFIHTKGQTGAADGADTLTSRAREREVL